jgi:2-dehydropantoate 2-reductase
MKHIGVVGIGAIGGIIGGFLTIAGQKVTLIEPHWREHAEAMQRDGLKLSGPTGEHTVKVKALFIDELEPIRNTIDILFITVKSNDTIEMLARLKPYLAADAWVISTQNGINEDVIIPIVGKVNVLPCVSYTGGALIKPGCVMQHDGYFVIGELDGSTTPRILEMAGILNSVRPTHISANIMLERWLKLSQVTMSVPIACISGLSLGEAFTNEKTHRLLAIIMSEVIAVAGADGYRIESIIGIKAEDIKKLAAGPLPEVSGLIIKQGEHFPPMASDAYTNDIRKGLPLEIDYTNGYVVNKAKQLDVPAPVNEILVSMIKAIRDGKLKAGMENVEKAIFL